MKSGPCPKCSGTDIRSKEWSGDHALIGSAGFSNVFCVTYVCASCGFLEDYVNGENLKKIKDKWPKRTLA